MIFVWDTLYDIQALVERDEIVYAGKRDAMCNGSMISRWKPGWWLFDRLRDAHPGQSRIYSPGRPGAFRKTTWPARLSSITQSRACRHSCARTRVNLTLHIPSTRLASNSRLRESILREAGTLAKAVEREKRARDETFPSLPPPIPPPAESAGRRAYLVEMRLQKPLILIDRTQAEPRGERFHSCWQGRVTHTARHYFSVWKARAVLVGTRGHTHARTNTTQTCKREIGTVPPRVSAGTRRALGIVHREIFARRGPNLSSDAGQRARRRSRRIDE